MEKHINGNRITANIGRRRSIFATVCEIFLKSLSVGEKLAVLMRTSASGARFQDELIKASVGSMNWVNK